MFLTTSQFFQILLKFAKFYAFEFFVKARFTKIDTA